MDPYCEKRSTYSPMLIAWDQIIALVEQYYTLPTELHGVIALLQGNYTELIADVVHLKSFWHAAHLAGKMECQRERMNE